MAGKGLAFLAGAVFGAVGSWVCAKRHFERIADEEIESVKEAFKDKRWEPEDKKQKNEEPTEKPFDDSATVAYNKAAATYSEEPKKEKAPYPITPDDFGDMTFNITLSYYDDGVVTDECDNVVDDVDEAIGSDFVNEFGHYEEDVAYIRNEARKCDYEIIREGRPFKPQAEG